MSPSKRRKSPSKEVKESSLRAFLAKLRKRHIIETLAAFIGGGWLLVEVVERLLVSHYHFPEKAIDITVVTLIAALICTLIWRWFSSREKLRKFKLELVLIPLVILITVLLNINILLHLKGPEPETIPASTWKNSIAVLPFVNLSPDKDQEYFCDGLTEELINRLSNISELRVPARTSAFFFKGKSQNIQDIGQKLKVNMVLEGSVRRAGNELRITAQLIDIADGYHRWSEEYDRELTDIFVVQDEIALAVADKLKITLLAEEKAKLAKHQTENPDAYSLYLRGRYFRFEETPESILKALSYFQQAIEKDPKYALAWSGLSDAYFMLDLRSRSRPKYQTQALSAANKALELDPELAEAHVALGLIRNFYEWNWTEAEKSYKRSIELNPGEWNAHREYGQLLQRTGRIREAQEELKRAVDLEPLSLIANLRLALCYCQAGNHELAIGQLLKVQDLIHDPEYFSPAVAGVLGREYFLVGALEKAREQFEKSSLVGQVWYFVANDNKKQAQAKVAEIEKSSITLFAKCYEFARAYACLGENDNAFSKLECAYATNPMQLLDITVDLYLWGLHSDPRFMMMLRRIGLENWAISE